MEFERKRHNHDFINIAPLVDVVFLLLLFFMIVSNVQEEPAIRIKLPDSKTAEAQEKIVRMVLITKSGEIYFMDKRVDLQNLRMAVEDGFKDGEKDFLKIKADRDVNVGLLVSVIDEVKLSGVRNFSIVTERG